MCHLEYVAICYEFQNRKVSVRFRCTISLLCFIRRSSCASICFSQCYIRLFFVGWSALAGKTQEKGALLSNVTANLGKVYQMVLYLIIRQGLLSRITNIAHQHLLSQDHLKIELLGHCYISISSQHILAYQIYT